MASTEINTHGELIVADLLRRNGYHTIDKINQYIIADSTMRKMLILVKTVQLPKKPADPTKTEIDEVKKKSNEANREAWIAHVVIDSSSKLVGNVKWTNLSSH